MPVIICKNDKHLVTLYNVKLKDLIFKTFNVRKLLLSESHVWSDSALSESCG